LQEAAYPQRGDGGDARDDRATGARSGSVGRVWTTKANAGKLHGPHRGATASPKGFSNFLKPKDLLVDLTGEESNRLFEILQEWEHHLAPFDPSDLRCDDEDLAP
jgi:hypothetical protein